MRERQHGENCCCDEHSLRPLSQQHKAPVLITDNQRTRQVGCSRQQIVENEQVVRDRVGGDGAGPLHHDRLPDATLVQAALFAAEESCIVEQFSRDVRAVVAREKHDSIFLYAQ